MIVTDYLCRNKIKEQCLHVLEKALLTYPHAPEIISQQTFINKCFGIAKPTHQHAEEIYYEDEDDYLNSMENKF